MSQSCNRALPIITHSLRFSMEIIMGKSLHNRIQLKRYGSIVDMIVLAFRAFK